MTTCNCNGYADATRKKTPRLRGWQSMAGLAVCLGTAYTAAVIGGGATVRAGAFYTELTRPDWAPPGWLFGPVWSLLYTLMGIAAWLVWRKRGWRNARGVLSLYLAQLGVNAVWSWLFFAWRLGGLAFVWILFLEGLVLALIRSVNRISRPAAWLLWPYAAWLAFATALAFAVWRLNPASL